MSEEVADKSETALEEEEESSCMHHWMIESPNGPTSRGVCKVCGVSSEFRNSMPGSGWDRGNAQARRARQARGKTT